MNRRGFFFGLGAALAAPAIVKATSLMPIKVWVPTPDPWMLNDISISVDGAFGDDVVSNGVKMTTNPFKTIQAAIDHLNSMNLHPSQFSEIKIAEGRYDSFKLDVNMNMVKLVGASKEATIINHDVNKGPLFTAINYGTIIAEGMTIKTAGHLKPPYRTLIEGTYLGS